MTTKWNTRGIGGNGDTPDFASLLKDEYVVVLLQGKNTFGDRIYSYLKVSMPDMKRMQEVVQTGQGFTPSDFGTIVAAGQGDPPPEVRQEIASMYKMIDPFKPAAPATPVEPVEKKNWDEY